MRIPGTYHRARTGTTGARRASSFRKESDEVYKSKKTHEHAKIYEFFNVFGGDQMYNAGGAARNRWTLDGHLMELRCTVDGHLMKQMYT